MSSITNSAPAMVSYYSSLANAGQSNAKAGADSETNTSTNAGTSPPSDPLAELRRYAQQVVARSEGGLLRIMHGGGNTQGASAAQKLGQSSESASVTIPLPDVDKLDREESSKLLKQVQGLIDAGMGESLRFEGSNGDKQTTSLETYRQWLQEKGGISVYA